MLKYLDYQNANPDSYTNYIGNIVYEKGRIAYVITDEGRLQYATVASTGSAFTAATNKKSPRQRRGDIIRLVNLRGWSSNQLLSELQKINELSKIL